MTFTVREPVTGAWQRECTTLAAAVRSRQEFREAGYARAVIVGPDGSEWSPHDGFTEWADCSRCGAHLEPTTDPEAPRHGEGWDGGCYFCGADPEQVGLRRE